MKQIFLLICIIFISTYLRAQEISLIYGNITEDELTMTTYEPDTSAVAVVIYEHGNLSYYYDDGFFVKNELKRKVKILKQEGVREADIAIPYAYSVYFKDPVTDIEAIAYNMENGVVVKTILEKQYIFEEEINEYARLKKFSIPGVKVGTVVEYKYTIKTWDTYNIPDWNFQSYIPVMNSCFEALIPDYYVFNHDATRGFEKIKAEISTEYQFFATASSRYGSTVSSNSKKYKFSAQNIPALKKEPYVWCLNDYISSVTFVLAGRKSLNGYYTPLSNTWEELEKRLRDKSNFEENLKMSNPYKKETKNIKLIAKDEEDRIEKIYSLVKNRIRWNEKFSLMGNSAKTAVKNGVGNSGQINMILLSVLKDADIKAYPVLISLRSRGRIRYPSLSSISTFVVCAETSNGKKFYMDGSAIHGGLNMLPINRLVDKAYVFDEKVYKKWVDLSNIGENQKTVNQKIEIDENGSIICERSTRYKYQFAYQFKEQFQSSEDSLKYIDKLQNEKNITITDLNVSGKDDMSNLVVEKMKIVYNQEYDSDYKYINPFIFEPINNPFIQSERKLPIEFDYPYSITVRTMFVVPDNYTVEEIPSSEHFELDENKCSYRYYIVHNDNMIQLSFNFELNQIFFLQIEYDLIRDFFGQIATKCSELIVLKKK